MTDQSKTTSRRIAVLISGRGSNLQAIISAIKDGRLNAEIAIVISNRPDAPGLLHARNAGITTRVIDSSDRGAFPTRGDYDRALIRELRDHDVRLICLAGFMRLLGLQFVASFPEAILNVHPSLLPAFPGLNAQYQAWEHGVKVSGVTVHFVNEELDGGPIITQAAVPVTDEDDAESLAARILEQEHRIYPEAIQTVLAGGWRIDGRRFLRSSVTSRP
jgi:phosphoribosylglycinamide formyltransferase-1